MAGRKRQSAISCKARSVQARLLLSDVWKFLGRRLGGRIGIGRQPKGGSWAPTRALRERRAPLLQKNRNMRATGEPQSISEVICRGRPQDPEWTGRAVFLRLPDGIEAHAVCRVCSCHDGYEGLRLAGWEWPAGYRHYIADHGVRPSLSFENHILTLTTEFASHLATKKGARLRARAGLETLRRRGRLPHMCN